MEAEFKIGDFIKVDFVRSNILTEATGWYAENVFVKIENVYAVTVSFQFNSME